MVTQAIVEAIDEHPGALSGWPPSSRYLMPIGNLPLICHVLAELSGAGIERAVVIAADSVRAGIEDVLDGSGSSGIEVVYAGVPEGSGEDALLREIRRAVAGEPVLVHPGDCLFPGQVALVRDRFGVGDVDVVVLARTGSTAPGATPDVHIRPELQPGRALDTVVALGPATRPILDELARNDWTERGLIVSLLGADCRFAVCELGVHWCYSDATEQLLAANQMVLDSLPIPSPEGEYGDRSDVRGRVAIAPSARITNSTIRGPAVIADGALVEDSFIGPYTAIGRGAIVTGAEIDNAIVLAEAEIRHPGFRIEASVIGERASISRGFDLPRGLHVRLGPGAHVNLS